MQREETLRSRKSCELASSDLAVFFCSTAIASAWKILSLAFAVVAAAAVIAAAGRMEAVVNLLSHKWIHLTDGAILAFAVSIIAVPEARERVPVAHYILAANALLLMVRLSVWTRLWRRHVRSLNQQQIEVDFWRMTTSMNLHLTWPIIVLCVVLAALAFAVLDDPFQAVMVVWTRVMNVRQGIKDMNFLTFLAVMVLPWALLSVFFGANDVM